MSLEKLKEEALHELQNSTTNKSSTFNKLFVLYSKIPNKNLAFERNVNRSGFTELSFTSLIYEIKKELNITDIEILCKMNTDKVIDLVVSDEETDLNQVDENVKIRDEFKFLNYKDCPEEFFIIVGKKISSFKKMQEIHAEMQKESGLENPSTEKLEQLAKEMEENRLLNEAYYKELDHYSKTGQILAEIPLFLERRLEKEVNEMTNEECLKFVNSSVAYFSRKSKDIEKATKNNDEAFLNKTNLQLEERNLKLKLVKQKLGVNE